MTDREEIVRRLAERSNESPGNIREALDLGFHAYDEAGKTIIRILSPSNVSEIALSVTLRLFKEDFDEMVRSFCK